MHNIMVIARVAQHGAIAQRWQVLAIGKWASYYDVRYWSYRAAQSAVEEKKGT